MKKTKLNLLATVNTARVNYLLLLKKILLRTVLGSLAAVAAATAVMYGMIYLYAARIKPLEQQLKAQEQDIAAVNEMMNENSDRKNDLDRLTEHSAALAAAPAITDELLASVIEAGAYTDVVIGQYDYGVDAKTGIHTLTLQGSAGYADNPIDFVDLLREQALFASVSLTGINTGSRNTIVFRAVCVMQGTEAEAEVEAEDEEN